MNNNKFSKLLIASALALSLAACGQKTTEESVASANQFIQAGKLDAAIIELKNAVNLAPEDGELRAQLGKLYVQTGQLSAAEKELHKARERGVSDDEVIPLLAQVYYYTDQFDSAAKILDKAKVVDASAKSTAELFQYMGSMRNPKDTTTKSLEDIKASLSDQDLLVAQIFTSLYDKGLHQADDQLKKLIAMDYRPIETEYLKALNSYLNADYASAVESFKKVKQLLPQPNTVNFQLVESLIKADKLDEADSEADKLLKLNANNPLINFYKGDIAYKRKNFAVALPYTEKAIQNGLDSISARMIAGVSAFQMQSSEQAYMHLRNLSQRQDFHSDDVNRLLARVQLSLGYPNEASDSLQSLEQLEKSDAELFSLTGAKLAMSGNFGSANQLLQEASKLDDASTTVRLRQAAVNFGKDEEQAIQLLKEVIENDKDLSIGWMYLAMAHIRNGDKTAALDLAKQWYDIDKVNGKTLEGIIYLKYWELNKSALALKEALSLDPKHLGANQYLLKVYEQLKQPENQLETAKNILSFEPSNLQALIAVVNAGRTLGQIEQTETFLVGLKGADGKNKEAVAAIALSKRLNGNPEEAIKLLAYSGDKGTLGYITLGDAYLQIGDNKNALLTYEKWRDITPDSLFPILRLIAVNEINGDIQKSLELAESSLDKFADNNTLKMLQLHYATKLNQISKATNIIKYLKAEGRKENVAMLPYYEGQLALNGMEFEKAEKLLSEAHSASPTYISAAMLAKAMIANKHVEQAKAIFSNQLNVEESVPARFKEMAASFYSYVEEYQKAADIYQTLISEMGESPGLLNNFAYNSFMAGRDLDTAKKAATKAASLAPDNAEILDTLGWIEFKTGQLDQAYINLSKASQMKPGSNGINLHFAELLISMGDSIKAKETLDKIKRPSSNESKILMQLSKKM